ncbi:MAG: leucine-rich repeat domain-containing protein [Candidatus Methanoplasma sp.]|jgi:hypothetical protein|nr:leucine-rich repeat domain-containing protein [Candidatus Methanoplasma sp.]
MKPYAYAAVLAVVAMAVAGAFLASDQGAPCADASASDNSGNIHWDLTEGVLTLTLNSGGGTDMEGYGRGAAPWYGDRLHIAEILVGDGITSIGRYAFYGCRALSSVTISDDVAYIDDYAFYGCRGLPSVVIPGNVEYVGIGAFSECYALSSVVIPGSVECIGYLAFQYCHSLASAVISDGVKSIDDSAFYECYALSSVVIPGSVEYIGDFAFTSCRALSSVSIPGSVEYIGHGAFLNCHMLSSAVISDGVRYIGSYAFSECYALSSVVIPGSVRSIGDCAFANCYALSSATIMASNLTLPANVFNGDSSLVAISMHNPSAPSNAGTQYGPSNAVSPRAIIIYYDDTVAGPVYATQSSKGAVTLSGFSGAVQIGKTAWNRDVKTIVSGESFPASSLSGAKVAYASKGISHVVVASSDSGSTITPSGSISVADRGIVTFSFSAKPGYVITAVEIDGSNDPSAVVAGTYAFTNVDSGHAISVTSKLLALGNADVVGDGGSTSSNGGSDDANVGGGSINGSRPGNSSGSSNGGSDDANVGGGSGGDVPVVGIGGHDGSVSGATVVLTAIVASLASSVALWLVIRRR